ncbi:hypothetical protein EVAR_65640_1 [Eumeta japonica]|uniref:Uncharacterized protein n=1 Tax=Eumeta variegata TaxID=151549 RepID=A0A4C1Z8A2_EUMVA|nr:hypothetical protein EVAR_65640_1 [Eumeta japonica]
MSEAVFLIENGLKSKCDLKRLVQRMRRDDTTARAGAGAAVECVLRRAGGSPVRARGRAAGARRRCELIEFLRYQISIKNNVLSHTTFKNKQTHRVFEYVVGAGAATRHGARPPARRRMGGAGGRAATARAASYDLLL